MLRQKVSFDAFKDKMFPEWVSVVIWPDIKKRSERDAVRKMMRPAWKHSPPTGENSILALAMYILRLAIYILAPAIYIASAKIELFS